MSVVRNGARATYNVSMSDNRVILQPCSPSRAIELKNELVAAGLVMDEDFVWRYYQAKWDEFSFAGVEPSTVIFEFRDPALRTFYSLRWING